MATYIALIDFTTEGIGRIQDTTRRSGEFIDHVRGLGVEVKNVFWTLGAHDGVLIFEAADDETATAALLSLGTRGMARTQTLRAFDSAEMDSILAKM
ncbi:MAG: GYD domain-containing protein [bacterium]|nr:GYD domain-containing protein [bacterium]